MLNNLKQTWMSLKAILKRQTPFLIAGMIIGIKMTANVIEIGQK